MSNQDIRWKQRFNNFQKAYQELSHLSFPISEKIHQEILSLPISLIIENKEVSYIVDITNINLIEK
jgi:dTDP-4-amino-4,6-dideoxygalactose transaminase